MVIHEGHVPEKKYRLMKKPIIDLEGLLRIALFVTLFVIFLLIYGLSARQSFGAGVVLAIFYEMLCKIHFRLRR